MNNEKSPSISEWPAGPNAFGLYLLLGMILALLVIGVFGVIDENSDSIGIEPPQKEVLTVQRSKAAGSETGSTHRPVNVNKPAGNGQSTGR